MCLNSALITPLDREKNLRSVHFLNLMTPLLDSLLCLLNAYSSVFAQQRIHQRAIRLALAHILAPGCRTISRVIAACGLEQVDWSADYRLFSRAKWSHRRLFDPVIKQSLDYFSAQDFITLAGDFTHLPKVGTHIPNVRCMRDPMSPPFHVNLIYGLRFVQFSVLLPLYNLGDQTDSPRSIPVAFDEIPSPKKPGSKATEEAIQIYNQERKSRKSTKMSLDSLIEVRKSFDQAGAADKTLICALDGSFTNKIYFTATLDRIELVCRARKDARLCYRAPEGSRRFYDVNSFTPESVRQNESIPFETCELFHGGAWRSIRYKEIKEVYWRNGAKRKVVRLIVLAPIPYRLTKKSRTYYRQPAYLLTTDLKRPAHVLIQAYLDRWQIEVNHREEKSDFGLGDAQVRNEKSVPRQPAFTVALYAMMLLAALQAYGAKRTDEYLTLPKWRKNAKRPSCLDIVSQLRREMEVAAEKLIDFQNTENVTAFATFRAAA